MQKQLKQTTIELKNGQSIYFSHIKECFRLGEKVIFHTEDKARTYEVLVLHKSILKLTNLKHHIEQSLRSYQLLNSKVVSPILEIIDEPDLQYIISEAYPNTLQTLLSRRQALSEFEAVYFLMELYEVLSYLRNRNCYLQKFQFKDIYLNEKLKLVFGYSIFFNLISQSPILKRPIFKTDRSNANLFVDLLKEKEFQVDDLNAWNTGVFLYELLEGNKPFSGIPTAASGKRLKKGERSEASTNRHEKSNTNSVIHFERIQSEQCRALIRKLLHCDPSKRIKFNVLIIDSFFKLYPLLPHILPETIFMCPPSAEYKQKYYQYFKQEKQERQASQVVPEEKEQKLIPSHKFVKEQKKFVTQRCLKAELSLNENRAHVEEYIDLSNKYGYGYQMSTGLLCFVFNDQTQVLFPSGTRNEIIYLNERKQATEFNYDKLPQEEDLKKKIFILQAFSKSIKKFKTGLEENEQSKVMVQQYAHSKNAAMFLLSNDSVQLIFNDKIGFLLIRNTLYIQSKNTDKFERYDMGNETADMKIRREYVMVMSRRIFHKGEYDYTLNGETVLDEPRKSQSAHNNLLKVSHFKDDKVKSKKYCI